jgi:hypothetical protein
VMPSRDTLSDSPARRDLRRWDDIGGSYDDLDGASAGPHVRRNRGKPHIARA